MTRKLVWLLLTFGFSMQSQCFDCNKNIGGHNGDAPADIEKLPDGLLYIINSGNFIAGYINKYDFNCNLVWSKTFGYDNIWLEAATSDAEGNIYLLITNTTSINAGLGPWNVSGFMMCPGMNFYKLNPQGDIIWTRHIGPATGVRMKNIVLSQDVLYITGTFYDNLTIGGAVSFTHPYTDYPRAFIAKYDTDGNFMNAIEHGTGYDTFSLSEIDPAGNTYMTYTDPGHDFSKLIKFDPDLNFLWSVTLSEGGDGGNSTGIYHPNALSFNSENQKLYIWGSMNLNTTIMGNPFFISTINGVFQSALTEFNAATGALTNIRRFDNNSGYNVPSLNGSGLNRRAFLKEKNGYLYILSSFTNSMTFPNGAVTTPTYFNEEYHSEELVLFKMNLSDFTPELMFQSHGLQNLSYFVADHPGPIVFNGNDLYLTAAFSSKPLSINGSLIQNNSGNNATDAMLYKFNIFNTPGSGTIVAENTCLNNLTAFSLQGNYDSIEWNFGEPSSPDNLSNVVNPSHQYAATGNYHVTALVTCGALQQTVEKDIVITALPALNTAPVLTACEDNVGSGISSSFDTSQLSNLLIGSQPNVSLAYYTEAGLTLPSPLPNPFTNTVANNQTVIVRAFFTQNPTCYIEGAVSFTTLPSAIAPTAEAEQIFCASQNATVADLAVAEGVAWHDAPSGGNVVNAATVLVDGATYYASIANGICESPRTPVTSLIQATPAPTGPSTQLFCAAANPTLADVDLTGNNITWYDSINGNILSPSTALANGMTYYATQTVSGCTSLDYMPVTVIVQTTLDAADVSTTFCDQDNDGVETVDLDSFQPQIIGSPENYVFAYFTSLQSAENQTDIISGDYALTQDDQVVFVRVSSDTGCHQIVKIALTLMRSPVVTVPDSVPLCKNLGHVTIHAGSFDSYLWSTGETTPSISVTEAGPYWVTVAENHNTVDCATTKNFNVFWSDVAAILAIQIQEWTAEQNTIVIVVDDPDQFEYSLDGMVYQLSNTFANLSAGSYTVFVRDKDQCGITTGEVVLLMYQKYFTPNGDGINDYWQIKFADVIPLGIEIFDRYGKALAKFAGHDQGWDGRYNGEVLPASDYWFVVTRADGNQHRGHFSLKR